MPDDKGENLINRTVSAPPSVWRQLDELAELLGYKPAPLYRQALREGLLIEQQKYKTVVELRNAQNVDRKLQRWVTAVDQNLEILERGFANDPNLTHEDLLRAFDQLKIALNGDRHK